MSLIIDMLKDLEKRQNGARAVPSIVHSQEYDAFDIFDLLKKGSIAAGVLIFTAILAYLIIHERRSFRAVAIPKEISVVKTPAADEKITDPVLNPVSVNAISYEAKTDSTEISFLLSHDTLYRVISNKDNSNIKIYLDNAVMQADMPTLIGAETGIKNISVIHQDHFIEFLIALKPDTGLKFVDMIKEGKQPSLVVSINNPKAATDNSMTTVNNIKSPAIQFVIQEKYQAALKLAESGNKIKAIHSLQTLIQYYPDYNEARVSLAAILMEQGKPEEAQLIVDNGLSMNPDYLPLVEIKARILTSEGKIREALAILQNNQPLITDAPQYHALIAALFSQLNQYNLAADIYQKLVSFNPHEGSWWFGLAVSLDKLGKSQDAVFAYTKAATEGRLNPQAMAFLQSRLRTIQEEAHAAE